MFRWLRDLVSRPSTALKALRSFGVGIRSALAGVMPGSWASDHREEAQHFTGWNYICIHAAAMQASRATVEVFQDDGTPSAKTRRRSLRSAHKSLVQYKSIYGKDDRETNPLPDDNPLVRLMKHPNPWESGAMFRYRQAQQLKLTGTCYVWNVLGKNVDRTVQRYVMPTACVVPQMPSNEYPAGSYRVMPAVSRFFSQLDPDGFTEMPGWSRMMGAIIDARRVQIVRLPHPVQLDDGQSPLSAGAGWIDSAVQIDSARFNQLRNGPAVSMVISPPIDTELSPEEMDAAAAKINAKYGGPTNAGKAMVVNGGTTITPLAGIAPDEMKYVESFDQMKAAVLALHQTPPVAIGIQEPGALAAYNASMVAYRMVAIQPMCDLFAESDTEWLAPEFGEGITIEWESEEFHDRELEMKEQTLDLQGGFRTLNEWRALRGLPPDETDKGDEYVKLGNAAPNPMAADGQAEGTTMPTQLNGAQVTAASTIVANVAQGLLPRDSGITQLQTFFNLSRQQAIAIMGTAGTTTPTVRNPIQGEAAAEPDQNAMPNDGEESIPKSLRNRTFWEAYRPYMNGKH